MNPTQDKGASTDDEYVVSAGGLLRSVADGSVSAVARRPVKVRARVSPGTLARGRLEVLLVELGDVRSGKLAIDRMLLRAEDVHVWPVGLQPHLRASSVGLKVTILQSAIDEWAKRSRTGARLTLGSDGITATSSALGRQFSEMHAEIEVNGSTLMLRPVRATILQRSTPVIRGLRWPLPLRLPSGVSLSRVEHHDRSLTAYLGLPDIDEAIPASVVRALRKQLTSMLLGVAKSAVTSAVRRL